MGEQRLGKSYHLRAVALLAVNPRLDCTFLPRHLFQGSQQLAETATVDGYGAEPTGAPGAWKHGRNDERRL